MSGIICWACLTLAISFLQFALLQWQNDFNKIQEKNESQRNQNLWWISVRGCHRSCRLQLQWARGRDGTYIKILGKSVAAHDRSGKLDKTSWNAVQQVPPHREEPLLDGNAHSVRYGEMIHDRTAKPVSVHRSCRLQLHQTREDLVWISRSWEICCGRQSIRETR